MLTVHFQGTGRKQPVYEPPCCLRWVLLRSVLSIFHRERLVINLKSWKIEQQMAFLRKGGADWREDARQAKEVSGERLSSCPGLKIGRC